VIIMGLYLWTTRDYNALMSQLATLQASVASLMNHVTATRRMQTSLAADLATVLSNQQSAFTSLAAQEAKTMSALDDLQAQVAQNTNLEQSAITLITGLAQQITQAVNNNDGPALQALAQQLQASASALGEAITAKTPQAPSAPSEPPAEDQPPA